MANFQFIKIEERGIFKKSYNYETFILREMLRMSQGMAEVQHHYRV